ncbi:hypothetical protein BKA70DRAFT_1374849 [Coprinopsis sp. MPI-PUGE-AT-0042]|nr:hypothetical protein BKA70DRAFT_1374849 [Coprinopsis sp. MPI-PUGE-AT-0042]
MRESNHCFPNQNKACVCINSQLYDRRALDTTAPLPLFNSLTHLSYLTSTSPRIREIMTQDGGLERLVRMLHDYCLIYGLTPPSSRPPKSGPVLNPTSFDKHAAYRFSLAFQCVVNIGVRGSEHIRSRVVQAGTLDVVGCVLEAWLASKGFAVGPSQSATGLPRETKEQRQARKAAQLEARQREEAVQLQRALQQTQQRMLRHDNRTLRPLDTRYRDDDAMDVSPSPSESAGSLIDRSSHNSTPGASDTDMSADNSITTTPLASTPTSSVVIPNRDRAATLLARVPPPTAHHHNHQHYQPTAVTPSTARQRSHHHGHRSVSAATSTDNSRPETETEDDGEPDGDVDMDRSTSASPLPPHRNLRLSATRRPPIGIVSNTNDPPLAPQTAVPGGLGLNTDAHIIINQGGGGQADGHVGVVAVVVDGDDGVEDGLVSLNTNDDFAMGAPPGAPGAITETPVTALPLLLGQGDHRPRHHHHHRHNRNAVDAPDVTPRAGFVGLPETTPGRNTGPQMPSPIASQRTIRRGGNNNELEPGATPLVHPPGLNSRSNSNNRTVEGLVATTSNHSTSNNAHNSNTNGNSNVDSGPYRDEDVLLALQLLAYLSKYPHVRQAFYKSRVTFHPASVSFTGARGATAAAVPPPPFSGVGRDKDKERERERGKESSTSGKEGGGGFLRSFRGKERASSSNQTTSSSTGPSSSSSSSSTTTTATATGNSNNNNRQTNVFSLVERFTFKPSSTETELPNPPPRLPPEIQYWAGVIMRNACRKDDGRGGIRQCANMLCGRWESYPREFAKCRRCRKAKYCGKECQSTAWSEGHRFWCSAKDAADEDVVGDPSLPGGSVSESSGGASRTGTEGTGRGITIGADEGGARERRERERERQRGSDVDMGTIRGTPSRHPSATATAAILRERTLQPTALPPTSPTSSSASTTATTTGFRSSVRSVRGLINPHGGSGTSFQGSSATNEFGVLPRSSQASSGSGSTARRNRGETIVPSAAAMSMSSRLAGTSGAASGPVVIPGSGPPSPSSLVEPRLPTTSMARGVMAYRFPHRAAGEEGEDDEDMVLG